MKFKVGDILIPKRSNPYAYTTGSAKVKFMGPSSDVDHEHDISVLITHCPGFSEEVTSRYNVHSKYFVKEGEVMGRRTFKLLKETVDYKKGLLIQEKCDDGDQEYCSINGSEFVKFTDHEEYFDDLETDFSRDAVEKNPTWFQEVFQPGEAWFTKDELDAFKEFVKKNKEKKGKK